MSEPKGMFLRRAILIVIALAAVSFAVAVFVATSATCAVMRGLSPSEVATVGSVRALSAQQATIETRMLILAGLIVIGVLLSGWREVPRRYVRLLSVAGVVILCSVAALDYVALEDLHSTRNALHNADANMVFVRTDFVFALVLLFFVVVVAQVVSRADVLVQPGGRFAALRLVLAGLMVAPTAVRLFTNQNADTTVDILHATLSEAPLRAGVLGILCLPLIIALFRIRAVAGESALHELLRHREV